MDTVYIMSGELLCEDCGEELRRTMLGEGAEDTGCSERLPQSWTGTENASDSPHHCASGENCRNAIDLGDGDPIGALCTSSLTDEGVRYVLEAATEAKTRRSRLLTAYWVEELCPDLNTWSDADDALEAMKRTLWLDAVATALEDDEPGAAQPLPGIEDWVPGPGGDWDDTVPELSDAVALDLAGSDVGDVIRRKAWDAVRGLWADTEPEGYRGLGRRWRYVVQRWCRETGQDAERFGHCAALEYLGHGVGLQDDEPGFPVGVHGTGECYGYVGDDGRVWVG